MPPSPNITIFQFWDRAIPDDVRRVMDSWRDDEAGLDVSRHDDASAEALLRDVGGRPAVRAFRAAATAAMRSDVFRYAALAKHGGLYVDSDIEKSAPLLSTLNDAGRGLITKKGARIANHFIFLRSSNDPLATHLLDVAIKNIEQRTSNNVWDVTGPGILTRLYKTAAPDDPRLAGIRLMEMDDAARFLRVRPRLAYKQTEAHWTNFQVNRSIYRATNPLARWRRAVSDALRRPR